MTTDRTAYADALPEPSRRKHGGQLRIFLGAAPGAGKSQALLRAAQALRRQNVDTVIGVIQTQGRAELQRGLDGLETLTRPDAGYGDRRPTELPLDALLARKPQATIVDALAHRNAAGGRHEFRYQDVEELLDAGIDVYAALDVEHVESLNDVVQRITGVRVRATVPDALLDRAVEIVLVDAPPRELAERVRHGTVFASEQEVVDRLAFYSLANLTALRDLAVQLVADRADADMRAQMAARGTGAVPVRRRVLVAIDGFDNSEYLVRAARKIAERRQAPWTVAFVDTGRGDGARQRIVDHCFALARRLGGEHILLHGTSVVDELLDHASGNAVSTIVIGRTRERPFARMFNRTLTQQLLQKGAHFELTIINTPYARAQARRVLEGNAADGRAIAGELAYASASAALATAIAAAARHWLGLSDLSLIFITAVLLVAVRTRMSVAVYVATLCFLSYNFFFIAPRYSLYISGGQGVVTVAAFLLVALLCGRIANRLRAQVLMLRAAHAHTAALQGLAQHLAAAANEDEVCRAAIRALRDSLVADVVVLAVDEGSGRLRSVAGEPGGIALETEAEAAAHWCLAQGKGAGRGTDTLNRTPWWFLPLLVGEETYGVVGLRLAGTPTPWPSELRRLAQAMVQDLAQALARARLVDQLEASRMQGETERLRAALLSSVSHDLRSPLSSIIGSAESLSAYRDKLSGEDQRALADGIVSEGQRLDRYIQNLLDMTRLGHGSLQLEREWIGFDEICGAALPRLRKQYPGIEVALRLPEPSPLLHVHPALIEQALFNVLDNAGKFSPPGAPLGLSGEIVDERLRIEVSDQGPGIAVEDRPRIFDMFYSVARGDRDGHGTGLGLTICQGIVAAHGGQVQALAGSDGRGTVIRITLPLSAPPSAQPRDE